MSKPLRVLLIEDSAADAEMLLEELRRSGYEPDHVQVASADKLHAALQEGPWDVVVSDYSMPGFDGLAALRIIRESGLEIPFIMISGTIGEDMAVSAMRAGAHDYLLKGNLTRLAPALERELRESAFRRRRRQTEEQLREQAQLLDLASDAIIVLDKDDCVAFWNRQAARLYGWSADEAARRTATELIYADAAAYETAKATLLSTGEWHGEVRQTTRAKTEVTVYSRWTLVRDAEGQPKSVLQINTDITERKQLEAQFLRTQRMESVGILAGGIAHDLNNILSPIIMASQMLKYLPLSEEGRSLAGTIETSAQRGADVVKQVLTFARGIEGDRILLQPVHLLKEMAQIAGETFPRSINIQLHTPAGLWPVIGDPTQLHQVVLNLCVNARDAMPDGGVLTLGAANVSIDEQYASMSPEASPGNFSVIEVRDTGTGIPRHVLDKIFDPFFTTKEQGKGTGLGLSTTLGIVKSHGGFIQVHSEMDRGSTFKVYLPAKPGEQAPARLPEPESLLKGAGELILVVDDEPSIRDVTRRILARHGYEVILAADGTEATAVFAQHADRIQLVLTDVMMPHMDGVALLRVLKKIKPSVKVIASSGMGSGEGLGLKITELQNLGAHKFLPKPYRTEELLKTLREALRSRE
ncbi:MAG: response regulator [Verrucomicrobiota bacterium]